MPTGMLAGIAWGRHTHQPKPLPSRKRQSLDQDPQKDGHAQCLAGPAEYFASHPWQAWAFYPTLLSREGSVESLCTEGHANPRESPFWFLPHAPGGSTTLFEGQGSSPCHRAAHTTPTQPRSAQAPHIGGWPRPISWLPGTRAPGRGRQRDVVAGPVLAAPSHAPGPRPRQAAGWPWAHPGVGVAAHAGAGAFPSNSAVGARSAMCKLIGGFSPCPPHAKQPTKPPSPCTTIASCSHSSLFPIPRRPPSHTHRTKADRRHRAPLRV